MTEKIPDSDRIAALLAPLTNYERTRPDAPRWSLDGIRALLARPGASQPSGGMAVQVGGSKGKGTTAAYLAALGAELGLRTGVYSSPHVEQLTERVLVDGVPATGLVPVVEELAAFVRAAPLPDATFFEVMTAAAVECFARAGVDLAVYEVGLGGRLDATTAVPVDAAILTHVEREHTAILGDTMEAIAAEKAAIVREGCLALTAARPPALAVIEARARAVGAPLWVLGRELRLEHLRDGRGRDVHGVLVEPDGRRHPFQLPGCCRHEVEALALAWGCLAGLRPDLRPALDRTLDRATWRPQLPARFEVVQHGPDDPAPVVLDGAHTDGSLAAAAAELHRLLPSGRWTLLAGCAAGKRWREGLSRLAPLVDRAFVTAVAGTPSEDPQAIAGHLSACGVPSVEVVDGAEAGWGRLCAAGGPRLVIGSFYLAGAIRRLLGVGASNPGSRGQR